MRILVDRLTWHGDAYTSYSEPFIAPEVKPGDTLIFQVPCHTLKGEVYEPGDCLHIIERTMSAPHRHITTEGNWLVRGKDGETTVWSTIEYMLSQGYAFILGQRVEKR